MLQIECCVCVTPSKSLKIYGKQTGIHFILISDIRDIFAQLNELVLMVRGECKKRTSMGKVLISFCSLWDWTNCRK